MLETYTRYREKSIYMSRWTNHIRMRIIGPNKGWKSPPTAAIDCSPSCLLLHLLMQTEDFSNPLTSCCKMNKLHFKKFKRSHGMSRRWSVIDITSTSSQQFLTTATVMSYGSCFSFKWAYLFWRDLYSTFWTSNFCMSFWFWYWRTATSSCKGQRENVRT